MKSNTPAIQGCDKLPVKNQKSKPYEEDPKKNANFKYLMVKNKEKGFMETHTELNNFIFNLQKLTHSPITLFIY